jgi:hypothetical protein
MDFSVVLAEYLCPRPFVTLRAGQAPQRSGEHRVYPLLIGAGIRPPMTAVLSNMSTPSRSLGIVRPHNTPRMDAVRLADGRISQFGLEVVAGGDFGGAQANCTAWQSKQCSRNSGAFQYTPS